MSPCLSFPMPAYLMRPNSQIIAGPHCLSDVRSQALKIYAGCCAQPHARRCRVDGASMYLVYVFLGLVVGILVGFMGVGGGVVLVPAMVYLLHLDQHTAQGTSLFLQLPPLGLGALVMYWKKGQVDLRAGLICALGFLLG